MTTKITRWLALLAGTPGPCQNQEPDAMDELEIKAKLKTTKFHPGSHAETRSVRFTSPRFPQKEALTFS